MSQASRWLLFLFAIVVQSSGIALVVKSLLGTSPISSLPYVMSFVWPVTLGEATFAVNMIFILIQYLILKKDFTKLHFCQIPGTLVFSLCIDAAMYAFSSVEPEMYLWKMGILLVGTALVALGLALQGIADVLMLAGDGMVYAIVNRFHLEFGKVKTANDVILVSLAAILSYGDLGVIEGVREGTVISAIITGVIARFFLRVLGGWKDGRRVLRFYQ